MKTVKFYLIFSLVCLTVFLGGESPAKAESYDLKAESLVMNSSNCEVNQLCAFTARVKNSGDAFKLDFLLKYQVSASDFKLDSPANLSPAQGVTIKTNDYVIYTFYGIFSKIGAATLNFTVDPAGYLADSDAANNSVSLAVSVTGYDLAVEELTVWPASPMVNQNVYLRVKVKNLSTYKLYTESGLNLARVFPDFSITSSSSTLPSLSNVIATDGKIYYGYEGRFTSSGEKTLNFTVDPDDVLKESNLANNTVKKIITVYNSLDADLAVAAVVFSSDKIILGEALNITIGAKNIGKVSLTDAVGLAKDNFSYNLPYFDYGINYPLVDNYPTMTSPLNPGDIFYYKFYGSFNQPGNFKLDFLINKNGALIEADRDNNATTTPVKVYQSLAQADDFSLITKSVTFASSTTAIIGWKTNVPTTGLINYGPTNYSVYENRIEDKVSSSEHAVSLNNLGPGEKYDYIMTVKNGAVEKTEALDNFIMPADNALKITAGPSLTISGKDVLFNWTMNLHASGYVYYKKRGTSDLLSAGLAALAAAPQIEIKNLAAGKYDYYLSSTSSPGTTVKTGWADFEIKAAAAEVAPVNNNSPVAAPTGANLSFSAKDPALYGRLKGKIVLKVKAAGEAYYVSAKENKLYYLGRPADAFAVIRSQGVGINNVNLAKIPIGLSALSGTDTDQDGLPNAFEDAIGTDKNKIDSDDDGFNDEAELISGHAPWSKNLKINYDNKFAAAQKGKIFLEVENRGQAWYVNPADGQRYFLARPVDAFSLMRRLGVGVSNSDFKKLAGR